MPNPGVSKPLKSQHRMEISSVGVESVEIIPTVQAWNEGVFVTRTANVVNVEAVETTPTIDNKQDHPTACEHFGLSA